MDRRILRLVAIADGDTLAGRDYVECCRAAVRGGATSIQVRMKHGDSGLMLSMTEKLVDQLTVPVIVNDRLDVAILGGAHGVHVGARDVAVAAARRLCDTREVIVGVSVGDIHEARGAIRDGADYWGVGPVYFTGSKIDAGFALGVEGFGRLRDMAPQGVPVIAIGGINSANCRQLIECGADGVAVIAALFEKQDVEGAARELISAIESVS